MKQLNTQQQHAVSGATFLGLIFDAMAEVAVRVVIAEESPLIAYMGQNAIDKLKQYNQ